MAEVKNIVANDSVKTSGKIFPDSFYKQIISTGPAILVADVNDLSIALCNEQFEKDTGHSLTNLCAKHVSLLSIIDAGEHDRLKMQIANLVIARGQNAVGVYNLQLANGTYCSFLMYLAPVVNEDAADIKYCQFLFFSEPDKLEFPFISSDSRKLFFEQSFNLGFGTFEWMIDSNKVFWSDSIYRIYEVENKGELIDRAFVHEHTHPDDRERVATALNAAVDKSEDFVIEYRIVTLKQNIKIISGSGRIIRDSDDRPFKLVGSVRDITEKKLIELNLQKNVQELHRSNKELEEFAYVASHDLQEPLRKITTFCDRLSEKYEDQLTGDGLMYMQRIMASAENMRILINNLLEFSRVTRASEAFSNVNLEFVIREVKSDLELVIEETGATIITKGLPVIDASLPQMKQLFFNIINNAIKFRKPDVKPEIVIQASEADHTDKLHHGLSIQKNYFKIEVKDNGIGFDETYAIRIFQIFQRLHGKSEYPGSGIGLAICKKIIEHHRGIIYAESKEGEGATFVFILPEKQ